MINISMLSGKWWTNWGFHLQWKVRTLRGCRNINCLGMGCKAGNLCCYQFRHRRNCARARGSDSCLLLRARGIRSVFIRTFQDTGSHWCILGLPLLRTKPSDLLGCTDTYSLRFGRQSDFIWNHPGFCGKAQCCPDCDGGRRALVSHRGTDAIPGWLDKKSRLVVYTIDERLKP